METLGQILRKEREDKKVTLEEFSRVTKIHHGVLEKMECDRWDTVPKGIFMKGFLGAYARQLSLNFEELWGRYKDLQNTPPASFSEKRD